MIHDTWYMIHDTWYMIHDTWYMIHDDNDDDDNIYCWTFLIFMLMLMLYLWLQAETPEVIHFGAYHRPPDGHFFIFYLQFQMGFTWLHSSKTFTSRHIPENIFTDSRLGSYLKLLPIHFCQWSIIAPSQYYVDVSVSLDSQPPVPATVQIHKLRNTTMLWN